MDRKSQMTSLNCSQDALREESCDERDEKVRSSSLNIFKENIGSIRYRWWWSWRRRVVKLQDPNICPKGL